MIESFKHRGLQDFFEKGSLAKVQAKHRKRLRLVLTVLQAAKEINDMNFPGSDSHPLKGRRKDLWSVRISGNWRIIFKFENGKAYDIDYIDYH